MIPILSMPMCKLRVAGEALNGRSGHEAGRELLARLYREETGKDCPEILVADRGKPYFQDSSLHFSISHTKKHVFCVVYFHMISKTAKKIFCYQFLFVI